MVNENNLPPIESKKPFETVYELKENHYEIKTSKLSLAARNKVVKKYGSDYLSDRAFINDIALEQMYGPGWGEWILKTTIVVGGGFVLGPIPAMVVGGVAAGGATIAENVVDDPDAKKVFGFVSDCGVGIATGGAIGAVAQGAGAVLGANEVAGLGSRAGEKAAIEAFKKTGSVSFAGTSHFLATAKHGIKVLGDIEKVASFLKDAGFTYVEAHEHINHVKAGYDYKSWCKVCTA